MVRLIDLLAISIAFKYYDMKQLVFTTHTHLSNDSEQYKFILWMNFSSFASAVLLLSLLQTTDCGPAVILPGVTGNAS